MKSTRIRTAAAVVTAVTCSGVLAGCSITRDDQADDPASSGSGASSSPTTSPAPSLSPSAVTSPSTSPSPIVSTSPSTDPGLSASATPPSPTTTRGALLSASELPRLNATSAWAQRRTGPIGTSPFGLCQKFDLLSIGALSGLERAFVTGGDSAGQQVAEFPDAQNTVRASKVIEAWHRDCATRVRGTSVKVRPITDVPVSSGRGWWYLASFERNGEGHFDSLGVVVSGSRMILVRMDHVGQDHNYPAGKDPMELAVKAASVKLG